MTQRDNGCRLFLAAVGLVVTLVIACGLLVFNRAKRGDAMGQGPQQNGSLTGAEMEDELHGRYGVPKRNPLKRHGPELAVVAAIVLAVAAALFVETWGGNRDTNDARLKVNAGEAAAAMLAVVGFPAGFWQWRKGREETSLDALYQRLEHINELMMAAQHPPRARDGEATPDAEGAVWRYVFAEVDLLEHTHERYKLGYATTLQLYRVVTRLAQRCKDYETLRECAAVFLKRGCGAGYYHDTLCILGKICEGAG